WFGYAAFDYKDIPTALGVIAVVYASCGYVKTQRAGWLNGLVAALVWLGAQKLSALALVIPSGIAILVTAGRHGQLRSVGVRTAVAGVCLYGITPPAWPDPARFVIEHFAYMSAHGWGGCTLTWGKCVGHTQRNWSAAQYLAQWYVVKTPFV